MTSNIHKLGLRRQRGCRSGRAARARRARLVPVLQPVGNGAYTVVTDQSDNRLASRRHRVPVCDLRHLTRITVQRHTTSAGRSVAFGSLNVRSLSSLKLEVLLVEFRDRQLDVMLLCKTWHDADSVAIRSLRSQGFRVIERAPPRSSRLQTSLGANHGGVAIVAAAGICMTATDIGVQPTTFECIAARITSGTSSCVAVVVYRPGSSAVTRACFTVLADLLDRLSTSTEALVLAGDINIRLERVTDLNTVEFLDLIAGYGLTQHVSCATHHAGGTLDVVCTRSDLATPTVDCQTIACCCGQCHYSVRRRSTPRQHVELGDRSTQTSSRPTCRHPLYVMIDVGKVWTVTHWISSTMTRSHV